MTMYQMLVTMFSELNQTQLRNLKRHIRSGTKLLCSNEFYTKDNAACPFYLAHHKTIPPETLRQADEQVHTTTEAIRNKLLFAGLPSCGHLLALSSPDEVKSAICEVIITKGI